MSIKLHGGVFGRNPTFNDVTVDGSLSIAGNQTFGDNDKAIFGAGSDLQIYHTGSNSIIDDLGTGNLLIRSDGTAISLQVNSKNSVRAVADEDVELYYNGNQKLATTSTGIDVTGNISVASGNGIDFSATAGTGTSELFDDYEEGLVTVTVEPSTSGTITLSGALETLSYTKVGNLVFVQGMVQVDSVSSPVGDLVEVHGLPFVTGNLTEASGRTSGVMNFKSGSNRTSITGFSLEGQDYVRFPLDASTVGVNSNDQFYVAITYLVD